MVSVPLLLLPAFMQMAHTFSTLPAATSCEKTSSSPPIVKPITPSISLNWSKLVVCSVIEPNLTVTGPAPARLTWSSYSLPEMVHGAVGSLRSHVWYELENLYGKVAEEVDEASAE